jgi:hypothetical protein
MRLLFILLICSVCFGQNPAIHEFEKGVSSSWLGRYEGQMEIYSPTGLQQLVGVQLDLQIMDRENYWIYNMSYLSPQGEVLSTKAYHIVYDETNEKLWMDEGDSLLIEMTQTWFLKLAAVKRKLLIQVLLLKKRKAWLNQCA